ncbi:MAG TPA: hypothetical protein VFQ85_15815 [Mycobacteriales bacterium]|jgi:hypothetical protein|nr:hypothetical protein [Mycobacteriales bacterium]
MSLNPYRRRVAVAVAGGVTTLLVGLVPQAHAASGTYVAGGTAVGRAAGTTAVDNGTVACMPQSASGVGGLCLPFGGGDAVSVIDDVLGRNVAFQVCVDNNGDGFCGRGPTPPAEPACVDQILFSHADDGSFRNPVGPMQTALAPCPGNGGGWNGYVVFLCNGAHVASDVHLHPATRGTAKVTTGGQGSGTFCGAPFGKRYFVAPTPPSPPTTPPDIGGGPGPSKAASVGAPCGDAHRNDFTGVVNQDITHYYGEIHGGPVVLYDDGGALPVAVPPNVPPSVPSTPPSPSFATMRCWLQNGPFYDFTTAPNAEYGYPALAGASTHGSGVLVLPPSPVEFNSPTTSDLYLCASIVNINGHSQEDLLWDDAVADPGTGQQVGGFVPYYSAPTPRCRLLISVD